MRTSRTTPRRSPHIDSIRETAKHAALTVTPTPEEIKLQQYLEEHKQFIRSLIKQYLGCNSGLDEEDYFQEAVPALQKALRTWDPTRGHQLRTFFYWHLRKQFTAVTTEKNFDVQLYDPRGVYLETIPYTKYRKQKKHLKARGITGSLRKREVALPVHME